MRKRFSAAMALALSCAMVLTACSGGSKPAETTAAAAADTTAAAAETTAAAAADTTAAAAADTTAAAKEESGFGRKVSEATESSPEKRQHAPVEKFFHYSGSFGPGTVYRWKCDAEEGNRTDTVWLHERGKGTGR